MQLLSFLNWSDGTSLGKDPSDITTDDELVKVAPSSGSMNEQDKSHVVLRRYDKLNDVETSQLLISGLYILKKMGKDGLRNFWTKSSSQERASLLQMIHLACSHFTSAKKAVTATRKKVKELLGFSPSCFIIWNNAFHHNITPQKRKLNSLRCLCVSTKGFWLVG